MTDTSEGAKREEPDLSTDDAPPGLRWLLPPRPLTPEEEEWALEAIAEFRRTTGQSEV
jgi:hypothetical protein